MEMSASRRMATVLLRRMVAFYHCVFVQELPVSDRGIPGKINLSRSLTNQINRRDFTLFGRVDQTRCRLWHHLGAAVPLQSDTNGAPPRHPVV